MKYNVGDKVRIKSLDWYNQNKDEYGYVKDFSPMMKTFCGKTMTICRCFGGDKFFEMEEDNGFENDTKFLFTMDMIEGLAEITDERLTEIAEKVFGKEEPFGLSCQYSCDSGNYEWKHEFDCPDGYEFRDENGNVIEAKKIVLEKKKKEYPKTYEECAKVLLDRASVRNDFGYKGELLVALQKLLVCRDAYWKIAGDWKPDYDSGVDKFGIFCYDGVISKTGAMSHWERHSNKILDFPTIEMRDVFYENFKELIESVKELL